MKNNDELAIVGFIGIVILFIIIIVFGPLISIWALNTLFPVLAIPYTIATWFSVFWLFGGIGAIIKKILG